MSTHYSTPQGQIQGRDGSQGAFMCLSVLRDPVKEVLWPLASCGRLDHDSKVNQNRPLHRHLTARAVLLGGL